MMIKQRCQKDCFLACLAMVLDITYEAMASRLGPEFVEHVCKEGLVGSKDIDHAFGALGLTRDLHFRVLFPLPEHASAGFIRNILWGRRACIQVRSKNYNDEFHIVYFDGEALHDPSTKRTYAWEEVEPVYIWLFAEQFVR